MQSHDLVVDPIELIQTTSSAELIEKGSIAVGAAGLVASNKMKVFPKSIFV